MKRILIGAAVIGFSAFALASPANAARGVSLCEPVPASEVTWPAGGPAYNFEQAPPANDRAFEKVCNFE